MRIPFISLIAGSALALGGCAYGGIGLGMGYGGGYGDYGYSYGSPYGYDYGPYGGYGAYPGYYGGFGYPYGWYDNSYYPGTGIYVYDSYRRPRVWSSHERAYWTTKQRVTATSATSATTVQPNWSGFSHRDRQQQQLQTDQQVRRHRHDRD
jgi:hypothetical protein